MPLVETVTIELGSAIAKSILKTWLKDSSLGEDVSSSLIDLLKTRTSDKLAQRRGQRQFERIGEMVGENLLPIFEREGAGLDDSSKTAVALAVRDVINTLSSSLLADINLDPVELTKHLLDAYPPEKEHFDSTESELYRRIIQVSCPYIVDIASQLPAFNEHTFAEILKRETLLIEKTEQILEEARRIREWLGPTEAGRFEEDYRKTVARKLDELQLFGTDISSASRRHRLSVAYITLSVEQKISMNTNETFEAIENMEKGQDDQSKESERDIVSVDMALARSRYLLISGAAGSGKTTLLHWIAVKSALKTFDRALSYWNNTVPFYIRLRSHTASNLPKPEAFPGLIAPLIADTMPHGWVHTQLQLGRAVVLIDGIDEVAIQQREEVQIWLKDMIETYPHAYFIVTSRPHAIEEGWTNQQSFQLAELQAMQLSDIYTFIDHWHRAVREELQEEEEKAELISLAEQLKVDIKRNRPLYNLAVNPLLCAMLCALNRDRRQQLPTDRIELYEACISLLLERRDKERHVDLSEYPALNYRQKRLLLEDLAYWMIKNNLSETTLEQVDERFERKLKDMPSIAEDSSGSKVRRLFVERAGLIREPVAGRIDFTHRTFEEFLAAKAAIDEVDIGLLIEKAQNDQWREVIILACGLATKQAREELINGLVTRGDTEEEYRYRFHLLAVSCLETSIELGQTIRAKVEQRLSMLVPPKNMTEAKALAAAGESAVKYLSRTFLKKKYSATITAACVRTLGLIGTDAALEVLEEFIADTRLKVEEELFRTWDYFDRDIFAKKILNPLLQRKPHLLIEQKDRISSLEGFQCFTFLTTINLSGNWFAKPRMNDLAPLAGLINLTSLDLSHNIQISDLTPLAGLVNLTTLNLLGNMYFDSQISDLTPLAGLVNLTSLNLSRNQISDLTPLAGLINLTSLNLSRNQISDLTPLAGLINLTTLDLYDNPQISDLAPLAGLINLTTLDLSDNPQILDLAPLAGLINLTSLDLSIQIDDIVPLTDPVNFTSFDLLSDLAPLADLINLTTLNLSRNPQISDLAPLADLINLTTLNLSDNPQISDLAPLASLINLTTLDLSRNPQISDLAPLASLINLTTLNLSRNPQILDLAPLAGLINLTSLDLSDNPQISDLTPLAGLINLTTLNLSGCSQIHDLSTLIGLRKLRLLNLSYGSVNIPGELKGIIPFFEIPTSIDE